MSNQQSTNNPYRATCPTCGAHPAEYCRANYVDGVGYIPHPARLSAQPEPQSEAEAQRAADYSRRRALLDTLTAEWTAGLNQFIAEGNGDSFDYSRTRHYPTIADVA